MKKQLKPKRVIVDGKYSFDTTLPVCLGSRVLLPSPDWLRDVKGPTWEGTVTSLQSDYTGPCNNIMAIVEYK